MGQSSSKHCVEMFNKGTIIEGVRHSRIKGKKVDGIFTELGKMETTRAVYTSMNSRQSRSNVTPVPSYKFLKLILNIGCRGVIFAIEMAGHYWCKLAYFSDERGIPFRERL